MQGMMTFSGVAALAALVAQGKDFDRATLDAMLDKLAASPEPKVRRGPMAMCYKMAMPQPVEYRHICSKCGTVTRYVSASVPNDLAFFRDGAAQLRSMGLDIALEESALCRVCAPGPKMPRKGRLVAATGECAAGDEVSILRAVGDSAWILPQGELAQRTSKGTSGVWLRLNALRDFDYGEGDFAYENRVDRLTWIINGKRTVVDRLDVKLLKAFLSGELILTTERDAEIPLKKLMGRLRELLGGTKE